MTMNMAPRSRSPPSRRQSLIFQCIALLALALVYSPCRISDVLVEAKTPLSSALTAARSALADVHQTNKIASSDNTENMSRWGISNFGLTNIPSFIRKRTTLSLSPEDLKKDVDIEWSLATAPGRVMVTIPRGGSSEEEPGDESEGEYDSDVEEEYDTESEDEYDSEEEESDDENEIEVIPASLKSSLLSKSQDSTTEDVTEYDDLLTPPAMQQFAISIGVMMLSNRIDIMDHKTVRIARFAFVAYIVTTQVFLLYVRLRAKSMDDRTEITITNPLASLANGIGGAAGAGGNFMVKSLANQVLSSQTTILEYDLKQVKKANSALLFPMVFLYFLHFKMKQVQPLLMQTATGFMNLAYSPLFQVYVLGRNLERPFKPPANPMMEGMMGQGQQEGEENAVDGEGEAGDEEGEAGDANEDSEKEEDTSDEEDESDDGSEEYDSDEE